MRSRIKNIIHRKPNFEFSENYSRHWMNGSAFKTHFMNSLTVVFPSGEKFFIRSVKKALPLLSDKKLKKQAMDFIRQEAQHAVEHQKFFKVLRQQGYDCDKLVDSLESLIQKVLEPIHSDKLNLALTAGFEHITALLAEISLSENFTADAPGELKELFDWHAAEEIEHRSVAFDVLQSIDRSFALRVVGLVYAYIILSLVSTTYTSYFLYKDGLLFKRKTVTDAFKMMITEEKLFFRACSIFFRYMDPNFHPSQSDIDELADAILNIGESIAVAS